MSLELIDVRAKVTPEAHCALVAYARLHATELSEVIREVIQAWACRQIKGASMLNSCLKAKGLTSADAGSVGTENVLLWSLDADSG